jgi:2-polyprenyl-3-methyl-5-hydroxy-6-metoxy-1,4-benzoquinol methylase
METEPNKEIKEFHCIICGKKEHKYKFTGYDKMHENSGFFDIYECENCGLFTTHPILDQKDMSSYYPDNYVCYLTAIEDEKNWLKFFSRWLALRKRVNLILKKSSKNGRILDIGCATGILLSGMQKKGWECFGVEPDTQAAKYAEKRFGLSVINGYLENTSFPDNYFDIITIMDVLEHVQDPIIFINEIKRILKTNGWLIATLPNSFAWERYIFGPYWIGWDIPRHYRTFNSKNIKIFLNQHEFKNVKIFSFTGRQGAFMMSLDFWLKEQRGPKFLKQLLRSLFNSFLFKITTLPIFLIEEYINRSTIMSFFAQKR